MRHHRLYAALALAVLPLLAVAAMAPITGNGFAPTPAVLAKLSPQMRDIAAAAGSARVRAMQTRALAAQAQPYGPSPLAARFNAAGQVQVYLHFDARQGAPDTTALQTLGATRVLASAPLGVVQAWVPPSALYALAALPQVTRISIPRYAVVKRNLPQIGAQPRSGSVTTQGDQILGTAQLRQATGLTGAGVSVGIISNGVGTVSGSTSSDITQDQSTGDLPTSPAPYIDTSVNGGGSGDEGTAMMEIVYDMAPGAALGFCGPNTTVEFVTCLQNFASAKGNFKPNIVAEDLGFPGVSMFSNGSFASAVQSFAIANPNIQLFSAAGNDARQFWGGSWNPATASTTISPSPTSTVNAYTYTQVQNFGGALNYLSFPIAAGDTVTYIVQWDDTWPNNPTSSTPNDPNDYDVFLTNAANGDIVACNMGINIGPASASTAPPSPNYCDVGSNPGTFVSPGPQPVQGNQYKNTTSSTQNLRLYIYQRAGTPGRNLKVLVYADNHSFQLIPNTPQGSIYGQSALPAPYEITTTAINQASATAAAGYPIESYASQGPVLLSQPATGQTTVPKPDFTAVDCVNVTGVGGFGSNNNTTPPSATFCGTSATSEAVAAIQALLLQAFPGRSASAYFNMLKAGATPLTSTAANGSGNPNGVYGWGLVNAYASAKATAPNPLATISAPGGNVSIQPGGTVSFSGSCSANGAPGSTSLAWSFGSGASPASSSSSSVTVSYASAGTYTATLTCTNSAFNTAATATRTVTAAAAAPAPAPGGGGGGGGGFGLWSLAALAALAAAEATRRRRSHA